MSFFDEVKSTVSKHEKEVDSAISEAGDLIDKKTGSKYSEQVNQGEAKIEEFIDKKD